MRGFDIGVFADLTDDFNDKTKPQPRPMPRPRTGVLAALRAVAVEGLSKSLPPSRFFDLEGARPRKASRFYVPVKPSALVIVGSLDNSSFYKKQRGTLKLKNKVELPVVDNISRKSSVDDLAAIFKAEMKVITEKKSTLSALSATEAFAERRRHPLSQKSWAELAADAQKQKPREKDFDLAKAFQREMQAMTGGVERAPAPKMRAPGMAA